MDRHPAKLLIIVPMWEPRDCRRRLVAVDDALVVHHSVGEFQLELRSMVKLRTTGAHGYPAVLCRLAADLEAGYRVVIVERDTFLVDLEQLAREHARGDSCDEVERAAHVIAERSRYQIDDHLRPAASEYLFGRMILGERERRTKIRKGEQAGLNMQCGVPTPRAELFWHSLRHEWCDPRAEQAGKAAWQQWCRQNRPAMPRADEA